MRVTLSRRLPEVTLMRPRAALPTLRTDRNFRWRGGDVSRVEAISDAVFALALTLLIVSLEIPRTFDELVQIFRLAPLFLVCFFLIIMIWYFHYLFHRRYGLEDFITIVLNSLLLFVVLMYVYPLKFLFSLLLSGMTGVGGDGPGCRRSARARDRQHADVAADGAVQFGCRGDLPAHDGGAGRGEAARAGRRRVRR